MHKVGGKVMQPFDLSSLDAVPLNGEEVLSYGGKKVGRADFRLPDGQYTLEADDSRKNTYAFKMHDGKSIEMSGKWTKGGAHIFNTAAGYSSVGAGVGAVVGGVVGGIFGVGAGAVPGIAFGAKIGTAVGTGVGAVVGFFTKPSKISGMDLDGKDAEIRIKNDNLKQEIKIRENPACKNDFIVEFYKDGQLVGEPRTIANKDMSQALPKLQAMGQSCEWQMGTGKDGKPAITGYKPLEPVMENGQRVSSLPPPNPESVREMLVDNSLGISRLTRKPPQEPTERLPMEQVPLPPGQEEQVPGQEGQEGQETQPQGQEGQAPGQEGQQRPENWDHTKPWYTKIFEFFSKILTSIVGMFSGLFGMGEQAQKSPAPSEGQTNTQELQNVKTQQRTYDQAPGQALNGQAGQTRNPPQDGKPNAGAVMARAMPSEQPQNSSPIRGNS